MISMPKPGHCPTLSDCKRTQQFIGLVLQSKHAHMVHSLRCWGFLYPSLRMGIIFVITSTFHSALTGFRDSTLLFILSTQKFLTSTHLMSQS